MNSIYNALIKFFPVLLISTTVQYGFCQDNSQAKEQDQYGIKAGVNFAELWGNDALPESDRKIGYSFGVYGTYKLSKELKLQPEVIWSMQGEKSKEKGRYDISYINVPVMFKWLKGNFYSEVGPQLGILTVSTGKSIPDSLKLNNFETFDFGINLGVGYTMFEDWMIGIRYYEGLLNIAPGRDLRNSVIYIGISYRIF